MQVANFLALSTIKEMGLKQISKANILPMATGMALSFCLLHFKRIKCDAKYVITSRMDQKSCLKWIWVSNLIPIIVDMF